MRPATSLSEKGPSNMARTARTLLNYLWDPQSPHLRWRVVVAMVCLLLAKVANVFVPVFYKEAVDDLGAEIVMAPVLIIVGYGITRVASQAFGELRDFFFVRVSQNAQRKSALKTFEHLHNLSMRFHLTRQTGGLSRVIERGVSAIQFVLSFLTFNIVPTLLEILMVVGVLLYLFDWPIAVITFVTIGLYIFFSVYVTEWRLKYRRQMNQSDQDANSKAIDSLINYETVKYFGNEPHEKNRYNNFLKKYEGAAVKNQSSLSLLNVGQGLIIGGGLTSVMLLAAYGVKDGDMSVGDFVLVNTYLIQLYLPLNFLGFVYRQIKQSFVDMEKMYGLMDESEEVADAPDAEELKVSEGDVKFKNVSFSYEGDREILKDVSFEITPGSTTAVVGPSGAGKSTLSRLLYRFYDVTSGVIVIDGQDIRDVTQSSLRHNIGIVPQDTVLFNDTIEYNISYGNLGANKEGIEAAAKGAQILEFIKSLPKGFDTIVGERGLKLSGGEKQRVAIARTLLKNPKVLILDEATSALDSETEEEIQRSLNAISKDRTTLVIAHRLSTIVNADEILVLSGGEVVERGTHTKLLGLDGMYAKMWRLQDEKTSN